MWTTLTRIMLVLGIWLIVPIAYGQEDTGPLTDGTQLTADGLEALSNRLVSLANWMEAVPGNAHNQSLDWQANADDLRQIATDLEALADELGGDGVALDNLATSSDAEWVRTIAQTISNLEGMAGESAKLMRTAAARTDDLANLAERFSAATARLGFLVNATRSTATLAANVSAWVGRQVTHVNHFENWAHDRISDARGFIDEVVTPSLGWLSGRLDFTACFQRQSFLFLP